MQKERELDFNTQRAEKVKIRTMDPNLSTTAQPNSPLRFSSRYSKQTLSLSRAQSRFWVSARASDPKIVRYYRPFEFCVILLCLRLDNNSIIWYLFDLFPLEGIPLVIYLNKLLLRFGLCRVFISGTFYHSIHVKDQGEYPESYHC